MPLGKTSALRRRTSTQRVRRSPHRPALEVLEDRCLLSITPVTLADPIFRGDSANGASQNVSMSADGQRIVFESAAPNLVPNDFNATSDVFLYERGTGLVSLISGRHDGTRSSDRGGFSPKITADGRYVVYVSDSADLVTSPTVNNFFLNQKDVYVRDLTTGQTVMISSYFDGSRDSDGDCADLSIVTTSDGGAMVAWATGSANMIAAGTDTNSVSDVFVRKLNANGTLGTTQRVSVSSNGTQGDGASTRPVLSGNGRFVVFLSNATNLVPIPDNGSRDIFVRDLQATSNATELITISVSGLEAANSTDSDLSDRPISDDGRFIVFQATASNLVSESVQGFTTKAYLRDRLSNVTRILSRGQGATAGVQGHNVVITGNGNFAGFVSNSNDVADDVTDTNNQPDVFRADLRNLPTVSIRMASVNSAGTNGGNDLSGTGSDLSFQLAGGFPAISADGRYVGFGSLATNLVAGVTDANNGLTAHFGAFRRDLFLRDMQENSTRLVSVSKEGGRTGDSGSFTTLLSPDGRYLAFLSRAADLVPGDPNLSQDVFLRDLTTGTLELVSHRSPLLPAEIPANAGGDIAATTSDGRFVAFTSSDTTQYAPGITVAASNLFIRDTLTGQVQVATVLPNGTQATGGSVDRATLSANGQFIAFHSNKLDLDGSAPGRGVYFRDLQTGTTRLISKNPVSGAASNAFNSDNAVVVSPDGRWVAFTSSATNLLNGITVPNGQSNLYLYDRDNPADLRMVSLSSSGSASGNGNMGPTEYQPVFSADSKRLLYASRSSDLITGVTDTNNASDVFAYDLTGPNAFLNQLVSVSTTAGTTGNSNSGGTVGFTEGAMAPRVSADGRFVAFGSTATNLTGESTSGLRQIFVRDLTNNTTTLVSFNQGNTGGANNHSQYPQISGDGMRVMFVSAAGNLTAVAGNGFEQLYVRNLTNNTTQLVSVNTSGAVGNNQSGAMGFTAFDKPQFSPNGRFVAFNSKATDLVTGFVSGGPGAAWQLYRRDLENSRTVLVSSANTGTSAADDETTPNTNAARIHLTDTGVVTFTSAATNLIHGDRNSVTDVFAYQYRGSGKISGTVFRDDDGNGTQNGAEPGLQYRTIYLDTNGNRRFDLGEENVQTDATGNYAFTDLPAGTYTLALILDTSFTRTAPASPGTYTETLDTNTSSITGRLFGARIAPVDLTVDTVNAPSSIQAGPAVTVTWLDRNAGSSPITGGWQDAVYLSQDAVLDASDTLLTTVTHTGTLAVGAVVAQSAAVNLPTVLPGAYYFIVQTDRRFQVTNDANRVNNIATISDPVDVVVPTLTLGTPLASGFTAANQDRYFQVDVPASGTLFVTLDSAAGSGSTALYLRRGSLPTQFDFDTVARAQNQADQFAVIPQVLTAGRYYILARSEFGAAATASFTLTATVPSGLSVTGNSPSQGGNAGRVTVEVRGANFTPTTTATLTLGATTIAASAIDFRTASLLFATFDLDGATLGTYTLKAVDGGNMASAPGTFGVIAATTGTVQVDLITPVSIRYDRDTAIYIEYSNPTNQDVVAPLLEVSSPKAFFRHPDDLNYVTQYAQILATAPEGPAGILRPGQRGVIVLRMLSDTTIPHDDIHVEVRQIAASVPADWASVKDMARPATIPLDAWDAMWSNLLTEVGSTTTDYNNRLAQMATYLGALGVTPNNMARLWGFLLAQSNAALGASTLASATDAAMAAPGMSLEFGRSALQSISGRYRLGILGRGWASSWETSLNEDEAGNVTIDSGGSFRFFSPKRGGGYTASSGEYATLSRDGWIFTLTEKDGTKWVFLANGKLHFVQDTNGNAITLGYDGSNRLVTLTHSAIPSLPLTLAYNLQGRLASVTDGVGRATTFQYDASGEHLLQATDPQGTTQYQYVTGQGIAREHALSQITYPDGTNTFYAYDVQGRLTGSSRDGGAEAVTYAYDGDGKVTITDANNHPATVWFNDVGTVEQVRDALGRTTQFDFDAASNLISSRNAGGGRFDYTYDSRGNLTRILNPVGQVVELAYSTQLNQLTRILDARGNATNYGYDTAGNLRSISYPNGGSESFTYDPLGNLTETVNRRGRAVGYTNDARGRVTRVDFVGGGHQDYTYDTRDNLMTADDASGTTTLEYDPTTDRLTKISYPGGRFLQFTYNAGGQRIRSEDQAGFIVKYEYDAAGRLSKLRDGSDALIVQYTYDAAGQLTRKDNGNGTRTTYAYDNAGQLTTIVNLAPNLTTENSRIEYSYDVLGRRVSMSDDTGVTQYRYDDLGQLTRVEQPGGRIITYEYDAAGNRTRVVDAGVATTYTTDASNQIQTAGFTSYSYDADGNLQSMTDAGGTTNYSFNDLDQLVAIAGASGNATFEYGALGYRTAATRDGARTEYVVDPTGLGNVVGEYGVGGALVANYVHGLELVGQFGPNGAGFYDFDGVGSTLGITNTAGNYANRYRYLPFGETTTISAGLANPFTFVGAFGVMQEVGGLSYMRARYYTPGTGQFVSNDPIGLAGGDTNLRRYVKNTPSSKIDPTGLSDSDDNGDQGPPSGSEHPPDSTPPPPTDKPSDPPLDTGPPPPSGAGGGSLTNPPPLSPPGSGTGIPGAPNPADDEDLDNVISGDPNDILGPAGYGTPEQRYIRPSGTWGYTVRFENAPAIANAPAQDVTITHQLDADLDWSTFAIGSFGFGALTVEVPAGLRQYETSVAYKNQDGSALRVDVAFDFNAQTGFLRVTFRSIDPKTGEFPAGVLDGFLPVNDATGRGQGFFQYTVQPKATLVTGTVVAQQAFIVFDANPVIPTNTHTNIIDATPPVVVAKVPARALPTFPVTWSGTDDLTGLAAYDVYVSVDGGLWQAWLTNTTQTAALYNGQVGHEYAFQALGIDHVGNRQPLVIAQASTRTPIVQINLPNLAEDSSLATGTLISTLIQGHVSDPNAAALRGIGVTDFNGSGTWQYSTTGTSWVAFTAIPAGQARLLPDTYRVRFVPAANWNGQAQLAFVAWDRTLGTAGGLLPVIGLGQSTPFSFDAGMLAQTVTPVNDAPMATTGATWLTPVLPGSTNPGGTLISDLMVSSGTDVDGNSLGAAIVTAATTTNGTWQYSRDNGTSWTNLGAVATTAARLLAATDKIRFVPNGAFAGTVSLTIRAWDGTTGTAGGTTNLSVSSTWGGTKAYSLATKVVNLAVNNAPTLSSATGPALPAVLEDKTSTSIKVSTLLTGLVGDPNPLAKRGIALVTTSGPGTWQYSLNNSTWVAVGVVSSAQSLLLVDTAWVRFVPTPNATGTPTLGYRAWDQTKGTSATRTDTSVTGGASAFSDTLANASFSLTPVNDAPVVTTGAAWLTPVLPGTSNPGGTLISDLMVSSGTDVDGNTLGAAIVTAATTTNGTWQYSRDNGTSWTNLGAVASTAARLLAATDKIRFVPNGTFTGTVSLTIRAWDGTTGTAGGTTNLSVSSAWGGTKAYSLATKVVNLAVNNAPTLSSATGPTLPAVLEDKTSTSIKVSTLLPGLVGDPNPLAKRGIALVTTSGPGTWQYSLNNSTWVAVGVVSSTQSLLLVDTAWVRFVPTPNATGTPTLGYRAWDQTKGTSATRTDTSVTGGASAFSDTLANASFSLTAVQDAPELVANTPLFLTPTNPNTTGPGDRVGDILGLAWRDPDAGAQVGVAVVGLTGTTVGRWEYSLDGGANWVAVGTVTTTSGLLLRDTDLLRFVPNAGFVGTATLKVKAWDRTTGTVGTRVNPTGSAFGINLLTATALVNSAPVVAA